MKITILIGLENGDLLKLIAKRPAVTSCKTATADRFLPKILKTTNIFRVFIILMRMTLCPQND